jgi:hypothetical protein
MSQWTHVAGLIRIDAIEFLDGNIRERLKSAFGNCVEYEDDQETWDICNVPCGSEGSVQYKIQKTATSDSQMSWGVVYIWGDLRDYQDAESIYNWIKQSIENWQLNVRSCSVKIDVEYQKSYLVYDIFNQEDLKIEIKIMEIK